MPPVMAIFAYPERLRNNNHGSTRLSRFVPTLREKEDQNQRRGLLVNLQERWPAND